MHLCCFLQIKLIIFAFYISCANNKDFAVLMNSLDIKDFHAGNWVQRREYKSFSPDPICMQWMLSDPELLQLMSAADHSIGKLDAFADLVPDVDFFIKMHITKEATVSNKIEGTQTTFEEALAKEDNIDAEKRDDWNEVHNYIKALNEAITEMERLPISNRLICQAHKTLLQGVRGKNKLPGVYRTSQNWIGATLKEATFVPPTHEEIPGLMNDLEQFINAELIPLPIQVPHLVKIAMIHYQFETIHPFLDGNGRIGRLLITLYLADKGLLHKPTLYLSDFFERNRRYYYDNLTAVRTGNQMLQWVKFFLTGVIETAKNGIETFQQIIKLREDVEMTRLHTLGRKQPEGKKLMTELYKQPILEGMQIAELLAVHPSTANRLISDFMAMGILKEMTGHKRNRVYSFDEYIRLFDSRH